jgi:elongation factor G
VPMAYATEDIRNVALVGHTGVGKTELAEALLVQAGAIKARGSVAKKSTVCDFDQQEKNHGNSIDAAVASFDADGIHVNLIDTPGSADFAGRALSVLAAVETAAVVVSATAGIELRTVRMMNVAKERKLCRLIVINKIDAATSDLGTLLGEIRERFGRECLPINLPSDGGTKVIDCFFKLSEDKPDFSSVEAAHTEIIEQVVELDEELMSLYLEQGDNVSPEQLHAPFEEALRQGHLIPVCFVSAQTGAGIPELLEIIEKLMPNPLEGNPPKFLKGSGSEALPVDVVPDPERHVVAHVFKINIDPFVGKLGVFRVHQGTLKSGAQVFVGDGRKPIKVAHIQRLLGKSTSETPTAVPGDICALAKLDELQFDAVLHDCHDEDEFRLAPLPFPAPMLGLAIEPERRGDEQKLHDALLKLIAEDPCARVEHTSESGKAETVLYGLGNLHLRILLERMAERYGVQVKTHTPSIPYRETVTKPAEGHHRHRKQTGGAGQFGEVYLRIRPLARGEGFRFEDEIVGGAIPGQYIPAVEKGVRQILATGAIAGYPFEDVEVTVYDGKYHSVDSKEVAFVAAGKKAFLDAIQKATPIVLEPMVTLEVTIPSAKMGDVTGDLVSKRGRIKDNESLASGMTKVSAIVPLSELDEYQSRLKSLTGGEGSYTMDFSHYDPVPTRKQQELMAAYRPAASED